MAEKDPPPDDTTGDDDFAGVPDPAPRRSPVLAAVVIALAGAVLWHLKADLQFAFRSRTPVALGDARSLTARGIALADNTYVELTGQPDRRNSLFIEPRGEKSRQSFFRLLGTDSRLLVRAADTANRPDIQDKWKGRLRRFDTLGYAPSMRKYFSDEVKAARYLSPETLKQVIAKAKEVHDRTGEAIKLEPSTMINLDVSFADELAALASHEKYASQADAKHEVERLGLTATGGTDTGDEFRIYVQAKDRNAVIAKLESGDFGFALHDERVILPVSELSLDGDTLKAGSRSFPFASVKAASVDAPIVIPADAFVVGEGEAPGEFWWAPVVALLLVAFAAFNVWYLFRRRDSGPRHTPA
jgi:hypothetical protein